MSDSTRTREAMALFEKLCEVSPAERSAYLDNHCANDALLRATVEELLLHDDGFQALTDPLVGVGADILAGAIASEHAEASSTGDEEHLTGQQIGRYRIVRRIGSGGMATVYEALQDHPQKRVALKIISPTLLSRKFRQRFELEAQVLARLQHPGIAQVFDAGTSDGTGGGLPFIAMELIDGLSLTSFVRREQLDVRNRLKLFNRICDAVEHAHRNGVIHRDLKPGNILVDDNGQPKVLDFGIARITDADATTIHTAAGQLLGTVPYMSPEQVNTRNVNIDTRADVYALGVILYELLADHVPFDVSDRSIPDAVRIISEVEPTRLGTIHRTYRGDLETIVAKALEKNRDRRYASVSELAADVDRFMQDQPILARPTSAAYQLRKLVVRHKLPFAFAASLFVLVTAFAVWMSVLYARAAASERLAATEAETARQTTTFLVDLFKVSDPQEARGQTITVSEVLDKGANRIQTELQDQPAVRAQLQQTMGVVYTNLGLYDAARPLIDSSIEVLRRQPQADSVQLADSLSAAGILRDDQGDYSTAEKWFREAIAMRRRVAPEAKLKIANDLNALASTLFRRSRIQEARKLYQQALDTRIALLGEKHADVAETMLNLGIIAQNEGDLVKAEQTIREALAIQQETLPENHPAFVITFYNLGEVLREKGDLDGARDFYQKSIELDRMVHGKKHPHYAIALDGLGKAFFAKGRFSDSEPLFQEALRMQRLTHGPDHPNIVFALNNLATNQLVLGHLQDAQKSLAECVDLSRRVHGSMDVQTGIALTNLEISLRFLGQLDEALAVGKESVKIKRAAFKRDHRSLADSIHDLGEVYLDRSELDQAEKLVREALEMRKRLFGDMHHDVGESLTGMGDIMLARGDIDDAKRYFEEAEKVLEATLGVGHADTAQPLEGLGKTYMLAHDPSQAETMFRRTLELRINTLPPDHWLIALTKSLLGESLAAQRKFDEAQPLLRESLVRLREMFGPHHPEVRKALDRMSSFNADDKAMVPGPASSSNGPG